MLFVKASVTDRYIHENNCTNITSLNTFEHLLLFIVLPSNKRNYKNIRNYLPQ